MHASPIFSRVGKRTLSFLVLFWCFLERITCEKSEKVVFSFFAGLFLLFIRFDFKQSRTPKRPQTFVLTLSRPHWLRLDFSKRHEKARSQVKQFCSGSHQAQESMYYCAYNATLNQYRSSYINITHQMQSHTLKG